MKKFRDLLSAALLITFITVCLIGIAETALTIAISKFFPGSGNRGYLDHEAIDSDPQGEDVFFEWGTLNASWEPYVYWRRDESSGEFFNVGSDGRRQT